MKTFFTISLVFFGYALFSQPLISSPRQAKLSDIEELFEENYEAQKSDNILFAEEEDEEEDGLRAKFERWKWLMHSRIMPDGSLPEPGTAARERDSYLFSHPALSMRNITWSQIGTSTLPANGGGAGRVNVIRVDPSNSNIIYVGTAGGGVWKSTNGGTAWTPLTDNTCVLSIADIAIDPSNSNSIYIATGDGYGYCLGQFGDFWGGLYSAGVLHSTDGGVTWNTTGLSYNQSDNIIVQRLVIDPSNSNNLIAATKSGLSRSTDGGITWSQILTGHYYDIEFNTSNSSTLYCAGNNNIYKSTDGGATWVSIKSGAGVDRISLEVSAANSQVIYSLAMGGSFLKSSDGGVTWVTKTFPSGASFFGYYDGALACSSANSDYLLAGGSALVKSTDGGTTWTTVNGTHSDHHALTFLNGSTSTFYSGNDGGIYKTTNSGSGWTNLSSGLSIAQTYRVATSATNPNIFYSGWQDNGSNRWDGNNNSWTKVYASDGMDCMVDYTNSQNVFVSSQYGALQKSTNGGSSFSVVTPCNGNWVTPFEMDPVTPSTIYSGCSAIYKSTNGGTSWTNIGDALFTTSNNNCEDIAIAPSDVSTIYACSFNKIVKTSNGGSTWTTITGTLPTTNTGINQIAISNSDPNKVWICLGGYSSGKKIFKSTDGGLTWANISGTLPNIPINTIVYQNNSADRVYAGTDLGVFYIENDSTDWTLYSDGLPNVMVQELEINYTSNKLIAATYGRGLWQSDLVGVVSQPAISLSGNMNFGNVAVGSSSQQSLTVTNTGSSMLNISSLSYPSGFSGNWNSGSITAGGNHIITITFSPTAIQSYGGSITVNSDAASGTNTMVCSGSGIASTSITTSSITQNPICPNGTLNVSYTANGIFNIGNVFTAQMSNSTGSFSSPTSIGTLTSTASGSIACAIPAASTGAGYRIRVISSNPVITGTDNGSNLSITCPVPSNISTSNIAATSATVSWSGSSCASLYEVDYKKVGGNGAWVVKPNITGTSTTLTGLSNSTKYQWKVKTVCVSNPSNISAFTSSLNFKTLSGRLQDLSAPEISLYPNPSKGTFEITVSAHTDEISIYNLVGQQVWNEHNIEENTTIQIQLNQPAGVYLVKARTESGSVTKQIIIE